jgi:hypothetical protein
MLLLTFNSVCMCHNGHELCVWMNITLRLSEHTKSTLMLQRVDTANVNFRLKTFSKTHSNMWHMRLSTSKHVIMNVQNALPKHVTLRLRKHTIPDTINAIREYWIIPWSWHVSPCQPSQPNCHVNCHAISDVEWTMVENIHVSCNVEWKQREMLTWQVSNSLDLLTQVTSGYPN